MRGHYRSFMHLYSSIHIIWSATTEQFGRHRTLPAKEAGFQGFGNLHRVIFPGAMSHVNARLVSLGLIACQIGKNAGEGYLDRRSVVPGKFAEEIGCPLRNGLARIEH